MEVKPPVLIASIVVLLVLLVGGFMWYDRAQRGAGADEEMPRDLGRPPAGTIQ